MDIELEVIANIEGLEELEESLTQGSRRAAKKFLQRAHTRAGKILQESAEENAPYQEGDLAGEIYIDTTTNNDGMLTRVGPTKSVFWGLIQEFGAPEANVPALHWLEESAKEVKDEVLAEYMQALDDGLQDMKGGK